MKILVVEDNECASRLIEKTLEPLGHELRLVATGLEAVTEVTDPGNVDLIVTDLLTPLGTGFDLIDTLVRQGSTIPVVVCSGHVTSEAQDLLRRYAPLTILRKPFKPKDLVEAVEKLSSPP